MILNNCIMFVTLLYRLSFFAPFHITHRHNIHDIPYYNMQCQNICIIYCRKLVTGFYCSLIINNFLIWNEITDFRIILFIGIHKINGFSSMLTRPPETVRKTQRTIVNKWVWNTSVFVKFRNMQYTSKNDKIWKK